MFVDFVPSYSCYQKNKGKKKSKKGKKSGAWFEHFGASAAETNRPRRRDMEKLRERRDAYLQQVRDHYQPILHLSTSFYS